jgi:hypothetical protein
MPLKIWETLQPSATYNGGDYLKFDNKKTGEVFDPEAGKASDDPFAHLVLEDAPSEEAASEEKVSEYDANVVDEEE